MSMDVTFLGTGAAYPSPTRGASAVVLRCEGECWLFDCGEGTQTQLMKSQLKAGYPEYMSNNFPCNVSCCFSLFPEDQNCFRDWRHN
ncbi:T0098426 isoform 1 [Pongo abelii]|uniref:T0098426 isoform 1 n=1 Tax=Pongo abelii TaxID=9601 RepID=A0A2J8UEJ4_PONAB|nr:T0098426 isoform 1 [Pongo abelii]